MPVNGSVDNVYCTHVGNVYCTVDTLILCTADVSLWSTHRAAVTCVRSPRLRHGIATQPQHYIKCCAVATRTVLNIPFFSVSLP